MCVCQSDGDQTEAPSGGGASFAQVVDAAVAAVDAVETQRLRVETIRRQLNVVYEIYCPSKLDKIDRLLDRYKGDFCVCVCVCEDRVLCVGECIS